MISTTLSKAFQAFKTNKKYLFLTMLIEVLFFATIIVLQFVFFEPSMDAATRAAAEMSAAMEQLPETELYNLETILMQNTDFLDAYHDLLKYIAYFFLSAFAAWIIYRGPIWHLSLKTIYKKMPITTTYLKFALLSMFWAIALTILFFIYTTTQGMSLMQTITTTSTIISIALLLAVLYFSQTSFALIPAQQTFKNTFVLGVKHARAIIPAFIFNLILTAIAFAIPIYFIKTRPLLSLGILVIITIPALAFARLHIIIAAWQKH